MGAALPGGQSLGVARGSIQIDTASLQSAATISRQVGQDVSRSLGQISVGAQKAESGVMRLSRGIGGLRGELTGLTLGVGALSALGLKTAGSFEEASVALRGLAGGTAQATKLIENLRKQAVTAGLPFADMLAVARRLLPTFEGNTKELERWYDLVKRVAALNAQEGVAGAAFSINEALTSGGKDLVSLVERFNVSRALLREELANNGNDFYAALDTVLRRMGITSQTAIDLGQTFNASFRVAKDAALQLLATGFQPLLETLTPLLQQTTAWLTSLRETNPQIVQLGAGLATVATVGAPTLLLFNQLVEAGAKLKALGIFGALGKVGAAGAGVGLGIAATNAIGRATGNEGMANAGLSELWATIRKLIFNIQFTLNRAVVEIVNGLARVNQAFSNGVANMLQAMAGFVRTIGQMLPGRLGGNALQGSATLLEAGAGVVRGSGQRFSDLARQNDEASQEFLRSLTRFWGLVEQQSATDSPAMAAAARSVAEGGFSSAQSDAIQQWATRVQEIERDAANARLDATRQFEQQRTQAVAQYELQLARDAEDFARQRARQVAQFERQIADIRQDAAKRDAQWQADFAERVADLRADSTKKVQDIEESYARDRERAERDHKDRLLDAAARLDAVAVLNEQRQFGRQQDDAQTAYNERLDTERENLAERLQQETESHQERLQAAREADAERIADMQANFIEQQQLEDEDREIRLQRQADDFARQQEQAAAAQAERLAQIDRNAAEQRATLDASFTAELNQLGLHRDAWLETQKEQQAAGLKLFQDFWGKFNAQFPNAPGAIQGPDAAPSFPTSFNQIVSGSPRSRGEYLRGGATAAASGGSSRTVNIAPGAIAVYGAAGQSEGAIAQAVRAELERLLVEAGA